MLCFIHNNMKPAVNQYLHYTRQFYLTADGGSVYVNMNLV